MTKKIDSFKGEYRFLSNFFESPITYRGQVYPTVEHAYQAQKTRSKPERAKIALLVTPGKAKWAGKRLELRERWATLRFSIMLKLIRLKFSPGSVLAKKLLKTGKAELVEGNYWNDTIWGVCRGKGENRLGKILMKVRSELREEN